MYNLDFLDMNKFKIEFLKWFKLCFNNKIDVFMKNNANECYSLNGLIIIVFYDKQENSKLNEIQLFIANHEYIKNGNVCICLNTKDNKETIVKKLDNFKKELIKNNLVGAQIYN